MLIIDTSVAVKWVIPESGQRENETDIALDLISHPLFAPDCIIGEFANALFKKVRRGEIGAEQARKSVGVITDLVKLLPAAGFVYAALNLALQLDHPVHDCIFLIAAMELDCPLVTADEKFIARCLQSGLQLPVFLLAERQWS